VEATYKSTCFEPKETGISKCYEVISVLGINNYTLGLLYILIVNGLSITYNKSRYFYTLHNDIEIKGGVAWWVARLTRHVDIVGSSPIKGPHCFLEQETLPSLLSTGWFQEWIGA